MTYRGADVITIFDYTAAKADAAAKGLQWSDKITAQVDPQFVALNLTQAQVTGCLLMHNHYTAWAWTPQSWPWFARLKVAAHFLLGKGPL